MTDRIFTRVFSTALLIALLGAITLGQKTAETEKAIAARFAPVIYQALGESPRSDYITNFDFDGDWRGDNNWKNTDDRKFAMRAFVYYALNETATHYFIHYAVFHPRDYKGGEEKGRLLSELLRQGQRIVGSRDPTGRLDEATAAHENDMEGVLVVVEKHPAADGHDRVVFLETMAHNAFALYSSNKERPAGVGKIRFDNPDSPMLYVEPRGHGIEAYSDDERQMANKQFVTYRYTGMAEDPEKASGRAVGYDLIPIKSTIWHQAKAKNKSAYGVMHDYAPVSINVMQGKKSAVQKIDLGGIGFAFLGNAGGANMARPPWGWFDHRRKGDQLGLWFFDPAGVIKRDFGLGENFSTTYLRLPFWAVK